jgi:colanic acid biosynthesis glycosyl transferase WcaI
MVKPGLFSRLAGWLERFVYRSADQVSTISKGMVDCLGCKGIPERKISLVPNWIEALAVGEIAKGKFRIHHVQTIGKFLVAYAGNLGVKQGVDCLLRLAKVMEGDSRFHFLVIGNGADKQRLAGIASELGLTNADFLPLLAPNAYKEMLADVDLVFVAQRSGAGNNFFPSKLLGVMAQSKPLLVSADPESELARCVKKWGSGRVAAYDDAIALADHLRTLIDNPTELSLLGSNGVRTAVKFDRKTVLEKWRCQISTLCNASNAQ